MEHISLAHQAGEPCFTISLLPSKGTAQRSRVTDTDGFCFYHSLPGLQEIAKLPRVPEKLTQAAFGSITQIASAHAVIATVLTGVVLLQGAQAYSDRQVEKQVRKELREAGIDPSYASAVLDSAASPTSPVKASSSSSSSSSKSGGLAAPADPSQNIRRSPRKRK